MPCPLVWTASPITNILLLPPMVHLLQLMGLRADVIALPSRLQGLPAHPLGDWGCVCFVDLYIKARGYGGVEVSVRAWARGRPDAQWSP